MTNKQLQWVHYPENDCLPEHYSCPFALIVKMVELDRWDVWLLSSFFRKVFSSEEIVVESYFGRWYQESHAKIAVLKEFEKENAKAKGVSGLST